MPNKFIENTLIRKCDCCKKEIVIDVQNIQDVVFYKRKYYHSQCLLSLAQTKICGKRCSEEWKNIIKFGTDLYKQDTLDMVNYCYGRDVLYNHLLSTYNIRVVSSYIQKKIDDIINGKYKGVSVPVPYRDLAECWVAGQQKLDDIYNKNLKEGKTFSGDSRILYDMAIVMNRIPLWQKRKKKIKEMAANRVINQNQIENKIDYSRIKSINNKTEDDDISSIIDEI